MQSNIAAAQPQIGGGASGTQRDEGKGGEGRRTPYRLLVQSAEITGDMNGGRASPRAAC